MKILIPVILNQDTFEQGVCIVDKEAGTRTYYSQDDRLELTSAVRDLVNGDLQWIVTTK